MKKIDIATIEAARRGWVGRRNDLHSSHFAADPRGRHKRTRSLTQSFGSRCLGPAWYLFRKPAPD